MTYECTVCAKKYNRIEHLQRHLSSRSGIRPFRCTTCLTNFARADVLKRHQRTCHPPSANASRDVRKRRACDRCVRQKRACDQGFPCRSCHKGGYNCQRPSFQAAGSEQTSDDLSLLTPVQSLDEEHIAISSKDALDPILALDTSLMQQDQATIFGPSLLSGLQESEDSANLLPWNLPWDELFNLPTPDASSPHCKGLYSFQFLENFTRARGLISSFDCGTLSQRIEVRAIGEAKMHSRNNSGSSPTILSNTISTDETSDPLIRQTLDIVDRIKEVITVRPRNSAVDLTWSVELEENCLAFFSPANLTKYLELYWAIWHPNVNIINKPMFDAITSKSILIAAMALIGVCVSPDISDNENGRTWFNCVEEVIFSDDCLSNYGGTGTDPSTFNSPVTKQRVQAVQAAYIVCLYQNWEGSDESKQRIRRFRYGTLIATARDIGIHNARQPNFLHISATEFIWESFVTTEELIRCFLWIFLLDTAFVIFNNHPPRMMIKEMRMSLACPESCFQAENAQECYRNLQTWMSDRKSYRDSSLSSITRLFCRGDLTQEHHQALSGLGIVNLFVVTSAFHSLIFQYQNSFIGESPLSPIRNALANWKAAWILHAEMPSSALNSDGLPVKDMWKRIGFERHASEYWLLASLLLDRISGAESKQSIDTGCNVKIEDSEGPILDKYDETSMSQINELIRNFQNVEIDSQDG